MKKKARRAGATETFSVSVDPETKRALRRLADQSYSGNLSALVTDLAEDARRRMAAGAYLKRHGIEEPSPSGVALIEAGIEREVSRLRRRRKARKVA